MGKMPGDLASVPNCHNHPTALACAYCESITIFPPFLHLLIVKQGCKLGLCNSCVVEASPFKKENDLFVNEPLLEKTHVLCKECYKYERGMINIQQVINFIFFSKQYRFRKIVLGIIILLVVGGALAALYVLHLF